MKKYSFIVLCLWLFCLPGCTYGPAGRQQEGADGEKRRSTPVEVVAPVQKQLPLSFEAEGRITYDPRRASAVALRFGGRIEKLYVNYLFEPVKKGQRILEIYSPEIVTAQKELVYLLKTDPGSRLAEASRRKLNLLGLTPAQVSRLEKSGEVSYSLPVYSPASGYIYRETPGGMPAETSSRTRLDVQEGMYLEKGQIAFKIINTGKVRAEFSISRKEAPYIGKGSPLRVSAHPGGPEVNAEVDLVQPFYGEGEKFSKVWVYLDNPQNRFMPGQLVTAKFQSSSGNAWWIPSTAVLDLGIRNAVFVKEKDAFRARKIGTGRTSGNWTEVVSGLSSLDSIAADAHYMADSEGFIKIVNDE